MKTEATSLNSLECYQSLIFHPMFCSPPRNSKQHDFRPWLHVVFHVTTAAVDEADFEIVMRILLLRFCVYAVVYYKITVSLCIENCGIVENAKNNQKYMWLILKLDPHDEKIINRIFRNFDLVGRILIWSTFQSFRRFPGLWEAL